MSTIVYSSGFSCNLTYIVVTQFIYIFLFDK
nr:MAG TPA: hypothetical protein [Caudoviricetes sp.]